MPKISDTPEGKAEKVERLKEFLKSDDERPIQISKPEVDIAKLKLQAIELLANEKNNVFSELSSSEEFDVVRALKFADDPIPGLNACLVEQGIAPIQIPILREFIFEMFVQRHKKDRGRVGEYLKALDTLNVKISEKEIERKPSLIGRLL